MTHEIKRRAEPLENDFIDLSFLEKRFNQIIWYYPSLNPSLRGNPETEAYLRFKSASPGISYPLIRRPELDWMIYFILETKETAHLIGNPSRALRLLGGFSINKSGKTCGVAPFTGFNREDRKICEVFPYGKIYLEDVKRALDKIDECPYLWDNSGNFRKATHKEFFDLLKN